MRNIQKNFNVLYIFVYTMPITLVRLKKLCDAINRDFIGKKPSKHKNKKVSIIVP